MRLGSFEQTVAGWVRLRDAVAARQASRADAATDGERVALVLEPTGGYELAFALRARQQSGWQVHRPNPARVRAWAHSLGLIYWTRQVRAGTAGRERVIYRHFGSTDSRRIPSLPPRARVDWRTTAPRGVSADP